MSIKLITQEINRFLKSSEPEVICIMGKWGVGKTFAWNKFLNEAVNHKIATYSRYSYVSLFGQDNLESLKTAVFENTTNLNDIKNGPSFKTFQDALYTLENKGRFYTKYLRYIPKLKDYTPGLFLSVRNQIICLDDLERVGQGLSTKNVLGLVSYLKEQAKCKVVLLLNDEELENDAGEDFKKQLEKVIDIEMRFEPTAMEAADIGIDRDIPFYLPFRNCVIALNIINIRVIRKIQRLAKTLYTLLAPYDDQVFNTALASITLLGWITYESRLAPSIEFVKSFSIWGSLDKSEGNETEKEAQWRLLLNSIGFTHFDDLDNLILRCVQNGYIDEAEIHIQCKSLEKKLSLADQGNSFQKAWNKFHESLSTSEDDVLKALSASFKKDVMTISPENADGTISLFRDLGHEKQADELLDFYIAKRDNEAKEFYDPAYQRLYNIKDLKLLNAFAAKLESFKDTRDPKDVLVNIIKTGGWNEEDINLLSQLSIKQYYDLFKNTEGPDLPAIIRRCLQFGQYSNSDENMITISATAKEALKIIASESSFNNLRLKKFNILN